MNTSIYDQSAGSIAQYKLMEALPKELQATLPSVEDIETRVLKKYDCE